MNLFNNIINFIFQIVLINITLKCCMDESNNESILKLSSNLTVLTIIQYMNNIVQKKYDIINFKKCNYLYINNKYIS